MEEIEGEILEAEELTNRIIQLKLEISSIAPTSGAKLTISKVRLREICELNETRELTECIMTSALDGRESKYESTPLTVATDSESKHKPTPPTERGSCSKYTASLSYSAAKEILKDHLAAHRPSL